MGLSLKVFPSKLRPKGPSIFPQVWSVGPWALPSGIWKCQVPPWYLGQYELTGETSRSRRAVWAARCPGAALLAWLCPLLCRLLVPYSQL